MRMSPEFEQRNPATEGLGKTIVARPIPTITGVEAQRIDLPAAYITLRHQDRVLGTYLVTVNLVRRQPVQVEDRIFVIVLRLKRAYKPYTMHLIDFRHDKFIGTEKPRNFSSRSETPRLRLSNLAAAISSCRFEITERYWSGSASGSPWLVGHSGRDAASCSSDTKRPRKDSSNPPPFLEDIRRTSRDSLRSSRLISA